MLIIVPFALLFGIICAAAGIIQILVTAVPLWVFVLGFGLVIGLNILAGFAKAGKLDTFFKNGEPH
jgi:uncharacterized membrane protein YedE/YeeE